MGFPRPHAVDLPTVAAFVCAVAPFRLVSGRAATSQGEDKTVIIVIGGPI